ncbi:MAG TPA: methionine biosynthesis protein MetW [Armatimonadota bacterium]|jgi:methionine biosynthesis protein MetW
MSPAEYRDALQHLVKSRPTAGEALVAMAMLDARGLQEPLDETRPRWDHQLIREMVPEGASILDLGCGYGELLADLRDSKHAFVQGVERDLESVLQCTSRGVPVIQADLDEGLRGFSDGSFDYVVLEETLQAVYRPGVVVEDMMRVGRRCVVSFPNFGHWRVRLQLYADGRMPVTPRLPYTWHNTPNIRLVTIRDFEEWCAELGATIHAAYAYVDGEPRPLLKVDNVLAEEALFVISRG